MDGDKESLRKEAALHRARIVRGAEDGARACAHFFEALAPGPEKIVAAYWPRGTEFSPLDILHELLRRGNICALPAMRGGGERVLDFIVWSDGAPLVEGSFGLLEPRRDEGARIAAPDIVLVPLLAFDRKGYRLGYGKGCYDATLSVLRETKPVLAVGLAFAEQAVLFNLPREPHDVPLDWIVTPQGARFFGAS